MSLDLCRRLIIQATFKLKLRKERRERPRPQFIKPRHRKFFGLFKPEETNEAEQRRDN